MHEWPVAAAGRQFDGNYLPLAVDEKRVAVRVCLLSTNRLSFPAGVNRALLA